MTELLNRTTNFLKNTLHTNVTISGRPEISGIPFLYRENYSFSRIIADKLGPMIFVLDLKKRRLTPAVIRKEIEDIKMSLKQGAVYVNDIMDFHKRDRLIKYNVPFIVPEKQIYLPGAGLSLTENYRPERIKAEFLSPSSVCVLNYMINQSPNLKKFPLRMLSEKLGYSAMTVSRGLEELKESGLIELRRSGRELIGFIEAEPISILDMVSNFVKPVVRKNVYLNVHSDKRVDFALISGISALSEYTDLSAPERITYAGTAKVLNILLTKNFADKMIYPEEANAEFQIWKYNPVAGPGQYSRLVDPVGLFFLFMDSEDERVQLALDKLKNFI